jgi:hypothetical protein
MFARSLGLFLATLVAAGLLAGCGYPYWFVFVSSSYARPVIVRVSYDGGGRDVLVAALNETDVVKFPNARPPAAVTVLDADTCELIASGDLPTKSAIVTFGDPLDPTKFGRLGIERWSDPAGENLPPIDSRCLGR